MGNIIASKCGSCGFENKFSYGSGKFTFKTKCSVPVINKETLEFENINYLEHQNSDKYLFYTDDILKGDNNDNNTINSFGLKLNMVNNYCPNCKSNALAFKIIMFTD